MPITVAIVEDDARIRKSLALLINETPEFRCLSVCSSGEEALRQIPACAPMVVLMDIHLPGISGVECVRQLKQLSPKTEVVMLTVYEDSDLVFQSLEAGASGYLLKRAPSDEILAAVKDVLNGGAPMSSHVARKVVQSFQQRGQSRQESENLTTREQEILNYVAKGFINKEIADALQISSETVRWHLKSIYQKLHVRTRTEAAMKFFGPTS